VYIGSGIKQIRFVSYSGGGKFLQNFERNGNISDEVIVFNPGTVQSRSLIMLKAVSVCLLYRSLLCIAGKQAKQKKKEGGYGTESFHKFS
jgi:hypothetical protein